MSLKAAKPSPKVSSFERFDCEQRSPEWFQVRLGLPTASEFQTVIANGKGGGESVTRTTYLRKLAGEIITGEPAESYTNAAMERGIAMEAELREAYAFENDVTLEQVGFIKRGRIGCSPDSLVGNDGVLEVKSTAPHLLIGHLISVTPTPLHKAQCQGHLLVTGREWCDLVVGWPKMPLYKIRYLRDEPYIMALSDALEVFNYELDRLVSFVAKRRSGK